MSPIRRENKHRYPPNWKEISRRIRHERAGDQCECAGQCRSVRCISQHVPDGRCTAINHRPHPVTGSKVVLTVAHLNHTPEDCRDEVLLALCQACHLALDADIHRRNRIRTRITRETQGMSPLFGGDEL